MKQDRLQKKPSVNCSMFTRYTLVLCLTALAFVASASGTNTAVSVLQDTNVICDFGEQVTRGTNNAEIYTNLFVLMKRLTDAGNTESDSEARRAKCELLFVDDAVMVPLRGLTKGTNIVNLAARTCLWFIGDKSDVAAMESELKRHPKASLLAPGITRKDLAGAIQAVRENLKLPADHFRVEGLTFNRKMSKAYVRVVTGPGMMNCVGWGLMFHLGEAGWELVWSNHEWLS
jgi:hypothetical protein